MNDNREAAYILIFGLTALLGFVAAVTAIALGLLGLMKPAALLMIGSVGWLFEALMAGDRMRGKGK